MSLVNWKGVILVVLAVLVCGAPAWADEREASASSQPALSEKKEAPGAGHVIGGAVLTVLNIPLRGALCVGSTALAGGLYIVSIGTAVNATTAMVKETCGGPWVITPELVKGESSPRQAER